MLAVTPSCLPHIVGQAQHFPALELAGMESNLDHFLFHQKQIGCFSSQLPLCHPSSETLQFRAANLVWKCS